MKRLNLVGRRFGGWIVLEDGGNDKTGHPQWLCRCDCGNEKVVLGDSLKSGHSKSCGCLSRLDLVGQRFGRLLVIEDAGTNKSGHSQWLCKCNCGNEIVVVGSKLKNNHTRSCGCLSIEKATERLIEINKNQKDENHPFHGKHHTEEAKQKIRKSNKGKHPTKETLQKMSKSHKGRTVGPENGMYGRRGPLSPAWKGGVTPENQKIRTSAEMKEWRQQVFERDNYTCQMCGKRGGDIQAHHIYPFGEYPGRQFRIWNGITLCKGDCHEPIRGKEDQYYEQFLKITLRRPKKIMLTEETLKCQ